jgi:predicted aldo/keto reductase-like oxidoreductase
MRARACVDRCPFEVDVVSNVEKVVNLLER